MTSQNPRVFVALWFMLFTLIVCAAPLSAFAKKSKPKAAKAADKPAEKPMEWKGQYGGPLKQGRRLASDAKAWTSLWKLLGKDEPVALDFDKFVAVAVFVGERTTGGFTVEFIESETRDDDLLVRYRIKTPTGLVTQAVSSAWKVRAFLKPKGKVVVAFADAQ